MYVSWCKTRVKERWLEAWILKLGGEFKTPTILQIIKQWHATAEDKQKGGLNLNWDSEIKQFCEIIILPYKSLLQSEDTLLIRIIHERGFRGEKLSHYNLKIFKL